MQITAKAPAGASISAGSVTSSYQTVLTLPANTRKIIVTNDLDQPVSVSLNGTLDWMPRLPANTGFVIDIDISMIAGGGSPALSNITVVAIKDLGTAPTTGGLSVSVITGS